MRKTASVLVGVALSASLSCVAPEQIDLETKKVRAEDIARVSPEDVHARVLSGEALLVCAYESDIAFRMAELDGAISLEEFEARLPKLPKNQEIYFYCA